MPTADDVRAIVAALPEATERETWSRPTFRVRDRMFAMLTTDATRVDVKAVREEQEALTSMDPETFSLPPYVARYGWVGVRLASVDLDELRELLVEAWRMTAPKTLVRAYDAEHPAPSKADGPAP